MGSIENKLSQEELMELINDVPEEIDVSEEENHSCVEEMAEKIALNEELKRIKLQDSYKFKVSEDTKNSEYFKECKIYTETIGYTLKKLMSFGIDYSNALTISQNMLTAKLNEKYADNQIAIAKTQQY